MTGTKPNGQPATSRAEYLGRITEQASGLILAGGSPEETTRASRFLHYGLTHRWLPISRELQCEFADGRQDVSVRIWVPPTGDSQSKLRIRCDCPRGDREELCCHSIAALKWLRLILQYAGTRERLLDQFMAPPPKPEWQQVLDQIDLLLGHEESEPPEKPQARLTWRLELTEHAGSRQLNLHAYEQKVSKSTKRWTKGRRIGWERVVNSPEIRTTDADHQAAQCIERESNHWDYYSYYGNSYTIDVFDALEKLVGHPYVFWHDQPSQQVAIKKGQLGVAIVQEGRCLQLVPQAGEDRIGPNCTFFFFDSKGVIAVNEETDVVTVAPATSDSLCQLVQRIAATQPKFPKKAEAALLERLPMLGAVATISVPEELHGESLDADQRVILQLVPDSPSGLLAALRQRPAPRGEVYTPGGGPKDILGLHEGERAVWRRDLEQEVKHATLIAEELHLDRYTRVNSWQWRVDEDEDALDLLAAIEDREGDDVVVEWPEGQKLRLAGEVTPSSLRVQISDGRDWFGLSGTVDVGGEEVELDKLLAGLRTGGKFVEIKPGRFARIAQLFRERLSSLAYATHTNRSGDLELDATAAPIVDDLIDENATLEACTSWKKLTTKLRDAQNLNPEPPTTLTAELRDYQVEGYRWMRRLAEWGVGACLADDMGLGKTVQALAVLIDRMDVGPALVVAPTSVGFNWIRECERFAPTLRPLTYRDSDREKLVADAGPGDLVICSYGLLQRNAETLTSRTWGTLVLDEAQFIKNPRTKTAQAARRIDADWRLALTGTPLENHLGELWSLFRVLSPGLFGSWDRFRDRFASPIEKDHDIDARHGLSRQCRPFILRRTKSEVLDELPERTEVLRHAELSEDERKRYEDARMAAVANLAGVTNEDRDRRFEVLAALTRLRQIACHVKLVDSSWRRSSAKLDLLLEIVDELRQGNHRALVFSQFTQHLALIRAELDKQGVEYQYLDGQTPARQRAERIDAFQHGEGDLFLISLKAGGTGLNLTAADYVIHMDPWWNPAVEDQATDRAHRIGQTRPVTVYRLVTKDTIEEQILALHADKRDLVAGVLDGADKAGKLTTEQLVDLIRGGE